MKNLSLRRAACSLVLFFAGATMALAGSFQVNPVRAELSRARPVSAMTVRNTGAEPAVIQLRAVSWTQPDGKDRYDMAPDILGTPPIFTIPAGGSQLIRVGSRRPPEANLERAYRLFLQEVPPPPQPGSKGLRLALRLSIPLFVIPATAVSPELHWDAVAVASGKVRIHVANHGSSHAWFTQIGLVMVQGGQALPISTLPVYVLPGAAHDWIVDVDTSTDHTLRLTAQGEVGTIQTDLTIPAR
ncbi:fimbrial biogenesis chaperone [Rhodanobacter sp. Col0626]|uniref:fimbrial biogenesis chaperone n=1 Tax=Rhodanobacter sp. Col0626 TaxID=3415679 RepID=UPI003CF00CB4